jgi:hypothetical protein
MSLLRCTSKTRLEGQPTSLPWHILFLNLRLPMLLAPFLPLLAGCADSGSPWERTISLGHYDVTGPVCQSTGEAPRYPDFEHKIALLDFAHVTTRRWQIKPFTVTQDLAATDCTLVRDRKIFENYGQRFTLTRAVQYTFSPEGCSFQVTLEDDFASASQRSSETFADRQETTREIPFEVRREAGVYNLTSATEGGLSKLWAGYGCDDADAIVYRLSSVKP